MVIEPLANTIRNDELIKGLGKNDTIKNDLFVDYSLLTITNPLESMDNIKNNL